MFWEILTQGSDLLGIQEESTYDDKNVASELIGIEQYRLDFKSWFCHLLAVNLGQLPLSKPQFLSTLGVVLPGLFSFHVSAQISNLKHISSNLLLPQVIHHATILYNNLKSPGLLSYLFTTLP